MGLFFNSRPSSAIASILCFLAGAAFLIILNSGQGKTFEGKDLGEAINSDSWQKRVQALKMIERKKMEIADFPGYQSLLRSPRIPERYWLVRALGVSRRPETYEDLVTFLDDPHPNVVGMAFYALGQRGEKRAIKGITERIETSNHWYNQWYAYRALRTLGWKQSKGSSR
jgi:HEAT repeat protein